MKKVLPLIFCALIFCSCGKSGVPGQNTSAPTVSALEKSHTHHWADADYQQPRHCTSCGETDGEKLSPGFEDHGLRCTLKVGEPAVYVALCKNGNSILTEGELLIDDFGPVDAGGTDLPAADGYSWYRVSMQVRFSDANAKKYGWSVEPCTEDYYSIELNDIIEEVTQWEDGSTPEHYVKRYSVLWNGTEYSDCLRWAENGNSGWNNGVCVFHEDAYWRIPTGYDGAVYGFINRANLPDGYWEAGAHIYDYADADSLFFRLVP